MEDTQQAWLRPPQAVVPVLLQVPPATVVKSHTGPVRTRDKGVAGRSGGDAQSGTGVAATVARDTATTRAGIAIAARSGRRAGRTRRTAHHTKGVLARRARAGASAICAARAAGGATRLANACGAVAGGSGILARGARGIETRATGLAGAAAHLARVVVRIVVAQALLYRRRCRCRFAQHGHRFLSARLARGGEAAGALDVQAKIIVAQPVLVRERAGQAARLAGIPAGAAARLH